MSEETSDHTSPFMSVESFALCFSKNIDGDVEMNSYSQPNRASEIDSSRPLEEFAKLSPFGSGIASSSSEQTIPEGSLEIISEERIDFESISLVFDEISEEYHHLLKKP